MYFVKRSSMSAVAGTVCISAFSRDLHSRARVASFGRADRCTVCPSSIQTPERQTRDPTRTDVSMDGGGLGASPYRSHFSVTYAQDGPAHGALSALSVWVRRDVRGL
jgi:hypothetical protein